MVSLSYLLSLFSLLFISASFSFAAQKEFKPKALLLQVTKDPKTLQYLTQIKQRTPSVTLSLTVELGGRYLWADCDTTRYVSSTYKFYDCHTSQCSRSRENTFCNTCDSPAKPGCHNASCAGTPINPIAWQGNAAELTADRVSIQSTDGNNPTQVVSVPEFFFFCIDNKFIMKDLANGVSGMAGFGRTQISLSSQFARFFNFRRIFALCLSPTKGAIFLGEGPYVLHPNVNAASGLTYTPLLTNKGAWIEQPASEYYIGVKSIKINGQIVPINTTLLSFDKNGEGGTVITTTFPYTRLEPSIHDAFVKAFAKTMSNFTRVASVAPFEACYSSKGIKSTPVGPAVPVIDFVLQSEDVYWRFSGANSMVQVSRDVLCLGFIKPPTVRYPDHSISIGGYQLENTLLQFNVAKSVLGFSSSLLSKQTTCANFNFTSTLHADVGTSRMDSLK